jgi:hypothetical protein
VGARPVGAQCNRAGRGKVAILDSVRPLAHLHVLNELTDDPVQVGVTLTMAMTHHVHRHAVHGERHIGTVVRVEATQKVLVGLAAAGVLHDVKARDRSQEIRHAQPRAPEQIARLEGHFTGCVRRWGEGGMSAVFHRLGCLRRRLSAGSRRAL